MIAYCWTANLHQTIGKSSIEHNKNRNTRQAKEN